MIKKNTICTTETFGFDFVSVCEKHIGNTSPDAYIDELPNSPNVAIPNGLSRYNCETSIEEMAKELRNVSETALHEIHDTEDEDDGVTAAEILEMGKIPRRKTTNAYVRKDHTNDQNMDDFLTVEKILNRVLEQAQLIVSRGIIWGASFDDRLWNPLQTDTQISNFLHGLGIRCYGNTVRWFANRVSGDSTFRVPDFWDTVNQWGKVSLVDGLLDIRTNTFTDRTLEDRVTATLRYSYNDVNASVRYEQLAEAMRALAVTDETYLRLQEVCGVALHAEPSGQILFFQHWNPRIASIFTKLLSRIWSNDAVSFLGMRNFEQSFRSAQVLEHPIVISGKEGESTLRDISNILALVDGDGINADRKYLEPFDFMGRCSLICAGKNLPPLQKGSMGTFRYYLIRVNLTGDMSDGTSIRNILSMPKEFVLWSLEGLRRYIANNGRFTFDEGSDIPREDASILNFVEQMIEADLNGKIPSSALYDAYSSYCSQHNMPILPKPRLIAYLRETFQVESRTIRVPWYNGGAPSFGYIGIRFSEAYQTLLNELPDDGWEPEISRQAFDEDDEDEDYDTQDDEDWYPDFQPTSEMIILSD